jgi:flagellar motor switch protein FliN/FliY
MSSEGLSQDLIDSLLNVVLNEEEAGPKDSAEKNSNTMVLTDEEKDLLGEVGNISMGAAATSLSDMLGRKVTITTPSISSTTLKSMRESFEIPNIALEISYIAGITGKNVLVMKMTDAGVVANLMMGGDGQIHLEELSEIEESAVSEAMNQMMGSSATSMATMFKRTVDISPPKSKIWDVNTLSMADGIDENDEVLKIAFRLNIEDLVDSDITQVLSLETAHKIIAIMNGTDVAEQTVSDDINLNGIAIETKQDSVEKIKAKAMDMNKSEPKEKVGSNSSDFETQKISYKEFSRSDNLSKNTSSILDVQLNIEVVLGSAKRSIREIMNFTNGTLLELDQLGNQPVELHVNGKVVAYGEAVLVDGNLAINILDINKDNI